MLVEVVELRATGMKLTPEEVAQARRFVGNLTITQDGCASLHEGDQAHLTHTHLLRSLFGVRVTAMKGDDFMLHGRQTVAPLSGEMRPQAWWCRVIRK